MVRGSLSRWLAGSPRWKEVQIGDPEGKRQVRITGQNVADVDRVVASLDDRSRSIIVASIYDDGASWMRYYKNRFDCYLRGLTNTAEAIEDGLRRTVGLVSLMESGAEGASLLPMPDDIHPTKRALSGRKATTSLMVFVALLGGVATVLGILTGETLLVQLALATPGAGAVLIAASTIGSSLLSDEERRILDEFSGPPT